MKWKNICITAILVISILLISVSSIFASNNYEYNDVRFYVGGQYKGTTALRSDYVISDNTDTYFICDVGLNGNLYIQMQTGQPIDTGIALNSVQTIYAYFNNQQLTCAFVNGTFRVGYHYNDNTVYQPITVYINGGTVKLGSPVVTFSGNSISWSPVSNATAYDIRYSENGDHYDTTIVTNYTNTTFTVSQTGYYTVRAISSDPNFEASDWSTGVSVSVVDNSNGNILDWFISNLSVITTKLGLIWSSLGQFFTQIGNLLLNCLNVLPSEIKTVLYSAFVIGCTLGIIKHII